MLKNTSTKYNNIFILKIPVCEWKICLPIYETFTDNKDTQKANSIIDH